MVKLCKVKGSIMGRYKKNIKKYRPSKNKYTLTLPNYNQDPLFKPEILIKPEKKIQKIQPTNDFETLAQSLEVTANDWDTDIVIPELEEITLDIPELEEITLDLSEFDEVTFEVPELESPKTPEATKDINDLFIDNIVSVEHTPKEHFELPKKKIEQAQKSYKSQTSVYDEDTVRNILDNDLDKIVSTEPKKRTYTPPKYDATGDDFDFEKLKPFAGVIVFILFLLFSGCS